MKLDFLKYQPLYFSISALLVVGSVVFLAVWGLKPSIDFTGGSVLEIELSQPVRLDKLEQGRAGVEGAIKAQKSGDAGYVLKMKPVERETKDQLLAELEQEFGPVEELRFETVGPIVGRELIKKTVIAVILAAGFIMLYVAFRFKDKKYGVCAILAMFHDSLILLGVFAFLGHFRAVEVDTFLVTAVLTTLSFSVHDTVVVYDRIRESVKKHPQVKFRRLVNKAIAETLTRSVNNSMTIIFMLLSLYLLGGETIRWFIFALLVGTVLGTYSSTFTAAPLLVVWQEQEEKKAG